MNRLIIFAALLIVSACAVGKKNTTAKPQAIEYKTSSCFGRCKVENLLISTNLKMDYEGIKNVPNIGSFQTTINSADYNKLLLLFDKANFKKLNDTYLSNISDLPKITIRLGNKTIIYHEMNAPAELRSIQTALVKTIEEYDWAKK